MATEDPKKILRLMTWIKQSFEKHMFATGFSTLVVGEYVSAA